MSKKNRRGWGKNKKKEIKFAIMGNNCNGIKAKRDSLFSAIRKLNSPSCVLLQETKLKFPGTFQIPGYQIFEKNRKGQGGGLLTAIDCNLCPLLISTGTNEEEISVTQAQVGKHSIRVINAYGPQETESKGKIFNFWEELEKEIITAKEKNCLVLIQMDANAKIGGGVIANNPHAISENGKLLLDLLGRQNLRCLNAHKLCQGSITRHRKTINGEEKAILDYLIVCEQLANYLKLMIIDEKRENVLTKFASTKGIKVKSESDHNLIFAQFNLICARKKASKRHEIFDFKNTEALEKLSEITKIQKN